MRCTLEQIKTALPYMCYIHCVPKSGQPTDGDNFANTLTDFQNYFTVAKEE